MICSKFQTVDHPGVPKPKRSLFWRIVNFPLDLLKLLVVWPTNKILDGIAFVYLRTLRFALTGPTTPDRQELNPRSRAF